MAYALSFPRLLRLGYGALEQLPEVLAALGVRRPLLVSDPAMDRLGHVARVLGVLKDAGLDAQVHTDTEPEPADGSILRGVAVLAASSADGVVALGGGSVIDSAKAMAVLAAGGGGIRAYAVPQEVTLSRVPIIALPTTAGTGSEATRFTVITEAASQEKLLCRGAAFLPDAAVVDPSFTLSAPPRLTADTGLDALTHALEAYVSKLANPVSDTLARAAIARIAAHLERAYEDGSDQEAREAMMLGAFEAGLAFSNASVALVHGMSRPVGALFHVPHGLSNAMLLPTVTAFSREAALQRYGEAAVLMGWADAGSTPEAQSQALIEGLAALNQRLAVPSPAAFGIDRDAWFAALPTMAQQAQASGSPANNPRVPTLKEMEGLYAALWGNEGA